MHLAKDLEKYSMHLLVSNNVNHSKALYVKYLHFQSRQLALQKHKHIQTETLPSINRLCI